MIKFKPLLIIVLCSFLLSSCEAIGNIFGAGVWVGIVIVVIVIIVLLALFRRRS